MNAVSDRSDVKYSVVNLLRIIVFTFGVILTLYTIYYAYTLGIIRTRFSNIFLGMGISLYYFNLLLKKVETNDRSRPQDVHKRVLIHIDTVVLVAFAVGILVTSAYIEMNFDRLYDEAIISGYESIDYIVGILLIIIILDATRRAFGNIIFGTTVASVLYSHSAIGPHLPGILRHTGLEWDQIIREGALGFTGVYDSTILGIGTTWVAIFIMFAGMAKSYGLMDYILTIGRELGSTLQSGVAHIALIASMIMGSITGSAAANTATTGSFTIPMLKQQGVKKDVAVAIESVASSGGQMLPPIMGVAAFLMADILGVPYLQVIQAGLLPALLFYFSVGVAVHLLVLKNGWTAEETSPFDRSTLRGGWHFMIPLFVLIYTLAVLRYSPMSAGFYTILTMITVIFIRVQIIDGISANSFITATKSTFDGLKSGALEMAPLVGVLGAMGLIIQMVITTGLAQKVSTTMVSLGGGSIILVLIFAMIASLLFGLGMPTPAAYILVVILVAPGLIELGLPDIMAHMFVFYFAMLSAITPPVAIAVAVGSRIGDSNFIYSCLQALRIGAPGFIIPFAFVYNNGLISWTMPDTIISFSIVLAGTITLEIATIGYTGVTKLNIPQRVLFGALSLGILFGGVWSGYVQVALIFFALLYLTLFYTFRGKIWGSEVS